MQHCCKCSGPMSLFTPMPNIEMFICRDCKGIWFPKGMLDSYLKTKLPLSPTSKLIDSQKQCPACHKGTLMATHVESSVQLVVDICSNCQGIFLDANELRVAKNIAAEKPSPTNSQFTKPLATHSSKPAHTALFDTKQSSDKMTAIDIGLLAYSNYFVKQRKEWTEILVNIEMRNRYDIFDPNGVLIGSAAEHDQGALGFFKRMFLGTHRPFSATIKDAAGNPQLQVLRPFYFFLSDMFVQTNTGAPVGSIHRRFNLLQATYALLDNRGREFVKIKRPFWRFWLFDIKNQNNQSIGQINKRWGGMLRELFSSADSFEVNIKNSNLSDFQRALILAASVAIDFDHFEKQSKT